MLDLITGDMYQLCIFFFQPQLSTKLHSEVTELLVFDFCLERHVTVQ